MKGLIYLIGFGLSLSSFGEKSLGEVVQKLQSRTGVAFRLPESLVAKSSRHQTPPVHEKEATPQQIAQALRFVVPNELDAGGTQKVNRDEIRFALEAALGAIPTDRTIRRALQYLKPPKKSLRTISSWKGIQSLGGMSLLSPFGRRAATEVLAPGDRVIAVGASAVRQSLMRALGPNAARVEQIPHFVSVLALSKNERLVFIANPNGPKVIEGIASLVGTVIALRSIVSQLPVERVVLALATDAVLPKGWNLHPTGQGSFQLVGPKGIVGIPINGPSTDLWKLVLGDVNQVLPSLVGGLPLEVHLVPTSVSVASRN